ncbi:MAG TPA: energy transducer TonB [Bacteroidales bacterium]|nr:energy transducer TonB [Bacteroidales bacterium]
MTKSNDNPMTLFTASGCLTAGALERYVSGGLPAGDLSRVKAHLDECEFCSAALEGLTAWREQNIVTEYHHDAPGNHRASSEIHHNKNFSRRVELINERLHERVKFHQETAPEKQKRRIGPVPSWLAMAASIVLFAGIYLILQNHKPSREFVATEQSGEKSLMPRPALAPDSLTTLSQPIVVAENKPAKKRAESQESMTPESMEIIINNDEIAEEPFVAGLVSKEQVQPPADKSVFPVAGVAGNAETISEYRMQEARNARSGTAWEQAAQEPETAKRVREAPLSAVQATENEASEEESVVFTVVEESPEFPGGADKLNRYLSENLHYPAQARENSISGTVFVRFVVDEKGKITHAEILRGIGYGCDEEALRVVKGMPRWKPGQQRGKPVKTIFNLPVKFNLQ